MPEKSYPINLPKTKFPMKADLPKREPAWLESWLKLGLYEKTLESQAKSSKFVLHDGPPYANGPIHMGHALNKTLKDIVLRYKSLSGYKTPYVPGWDCHGLPIEQALLKELKITKREAEKDPVGFRSKCRDFVLRMVDVQRKDFMRLGLMGDWMRPYITMEPPYASRIVKAFCELYRKGYIKKGKKPVFWCIHCETALAQAEVEYHNKTSPSIYVAFPSKSHPDYEIVIWTTTPWTLPANRAVCVNPGATYVALELPSHRRLIVLEGVAASLAQVFGARQSAEKFTGQELVSWKVFSPLAQREVPVIADEAVSLEEGTGIVHTAPGHGEVDYEWGRRFHLEVSSPVSENGSYLDEVGWPELVGKRVDQTETTELLFELLKHSLVAKDQAQHSYPHCWRCKKPLIFRATEQWFLKIEHNQLRQKILEAIEKTAWLPPASKERIRSMVEGRPDWCLSRQRIWGAPIPILYCKGCGKENEQQELFDAIVEKIKTEGENFWFDPAGAFLKEFGGRFPCQHCKSKDFVRDPNILDVWMDSGVSWLSVLEEGPKLGYPADLYLEGSDQHRGWFQTSMITSVALRGAAPYKRVFTNGWVLDEEGRAMHKSLGNVVSPQQIVERWGADILRLWAASTASAEDVRISNRLMELYAENYRKIRNTLRYCLGNLADFKPHKDGVPSLEGLTRLEQLSLANLYRVIEKSRQGYEDYDFPRALRAVLDFVIHDLSNFYFDISKDRLYTFRPDDPDRRATQSVLFVTLHNLLTLLAPILPFTMEEAWQEMLSNLDSRDPAMLCNARLLFPESCHLARFPLACADWKNTDLEKDSPILLALRNEVFRQLDVLRKQGDFGSSLETKIFIEAPKDKHAIFSDWNSILPAILLVSGVELKENPGANGALQIRIEKADGAKCARCWIYHSSVGEDRRDPALCAKCIRVVFE